MLSATKPRGILPFRYRGFRLDRYLYFHSRYRITAVHLDVYWVLTPPIAHLFDSRIGAASPAEPPSRDIDPWRLGQPWTKTRTIASKTVSEPLSPFPVCFFVRYNQTISISPNKPQLNNLLTLSFIARHAAPLIEKNEVPQISQPCPVGMIISECGVGSCAS
jgi:hypothetical protein